MPTLLKDLRIGEVSSVDRGAGEGVRILMMKRDCVDNTSKSMRKLLADEAAKLLKAAVSIVNGKATDNHAKAVALDAALKAYEKQLGAIVPAELQTADLATIGKDTDMPTEAEKLAAKTALAAAKKSLNEARDLMKKAGDDPDEDDVDSTGGKKMKKALDDALLALAFEKMAPAHKEYLAAVSYDEAARKAFIEKTAEERDAVMKSTPIEKAVSLPASVVAALAKAAENDTILKALQEKDQVTTFAKRATDIGLVEAQGEILRKAYKNDADSIAKLEQIIKGLHEQIRTGKVFGEFGGKGGTVEATAYGELQKKAEAYREGQIAIGKKCSPEQAFTKVYTDPANAELKKRHDADEVNKRARVAA